VIEMQPPRRRDAEEDAEKEIEVEEINSSDIRSRLLPKGEQHDPLSEKVIGAAIEVHSRLGAGLTEAMYDLALCRELELRGIRFSRQVPVAVEYKGVSIGDVRIDLLVEGKLIVELKACDGLCDVHRAQCITYLRITGHQVALLINFNVALLKEGIRRVILSE
jgi:GxxExxY protein